MLIEKPNFSQLKSVYQIIHQISNNKYYNLYLEYCIPNTTTKLSTTYQWSNKKNYVNSSSKYVNTYVTKPRVLVKFADIENDDSKKHIPAKAENIVCNTISQSEPNFKFKKKKD